MTHDIEVIRMAYNKVLAAMAAAKEAGDTQRLAKLKPDYTAIKEMLTKAKEDEKLAKAEQRDMIQAYKDMNTQLKDNVKELENDLEEARAALAPLQEQLATARKTIGMLKTEVSRLDDENRSLRSPPPVEEYRKAQVMPTATAPAFDMADLMRDIDTFAPRNT